MDSMLGIMQLIKNNYSSLTSVEKRICDYLTENYEKIPQLTAQAAAAGAGVAKSAVVRCSRSLGFKGFSELKDRAAVECVKNEKLNYCPYISPEDGHRQILGKVFAATVKTLNDTAEKLDFDMAEQFVAALGTAENIYIYGVGTSAKQGGALTACITANAESPVMRLCDIPLAVYSDEINYPIEPMSARIAQISLINALVIMLSSDKYEETLERSRRMHELVDRVRRG